MEQLGTHAAQGEAPHSIEQLREVISRGYTDVEGIPPS